MCLAFQSHFRIIARPGLPLIADLARERGVQPLRCVPPTPGISADCVEIGNHFRRNLKQRRLKILAKMLERRCARNQQDIG